MSGQSAGFLLWLLLLMAQGSRVAQGFFFVVPSAAPHGTVSRRSATTVALHQAKSSSSSSWGYGDEDAAFDLEATRRRLESLVTLDGTAGTSPFTTMGGPTPGSGTTSYTPTDSWAPSATISPSLDVILPFPPPVLTSVERARRWREQTLLAQLADGDQALTDLWDFWFQERGTDAAACLLQAEELTGQGPRHWPQAEAILSALIQEHGVFWAEPVNRLATLYFMQGRFEEAETLCQIVLAVKPWHFGALSGIVMVYESLRESPKARQWAARRLPTFAPSGRNRRRQQWVQSALVDAQASLQDSERRLQNWMGPKDDYTALNDDSSWQ